MPPNVRQKGATPLKSAGDPHHFAWIVATISVATEKPARPSADGAAIGCSVTRVAQPFVEASAPDSGAILACNVLIERSPPSKRTSIMLRSFRRAIFPLQRAGNIRGGRGVYTRLGDGGVRVL